MLRGELSVCLDAGARNEKEKKKRAFLLLPVSIVSGA